MASQAHQLLLLPSLILYLLVFTVRVGCSSQMRGLGPAKGGPVSPGTVRHQSRDGWTNVSLAGNSVGLAKQRLDLDFWGKNLRFQNVSCSTGG